MKAIAISALGGPDVLKEIELPDPRPDAARVLVSVAATSVNPIDVKIRAHGMGLVPGFPAVLHGDMSGIVVDPGPRGDLKAGDEVYGLIGGVRNEPGALAQFASVDAELIARKPSRLSFAEAAALPVIGMTALQALVGRAGLKKGESLLVQGGAGGVGHIAVQLGLALGARVFASASEGKMERLRAFGALAFDYRDPRLEESLLEASGGGFDLVMDTVGGESLDRAFRLAAAGGRVAAIAARSTHDLSQLHAKGLSLYIVFSLLPILTGKGKAAQRSLLEDLARRVDAGELRPILDPRRFSFSEAAEAHRYFESGAARGKVVIVVDPSRA
jgi:NADPH2:quinone reductase